MGNRLTQSYSHRQVNMYEHRPEEIVFYRAADSQGRPLQRTDDYASPSQGQEPPGKGCGLEMYDDVHSSTKYLAANRWLRRTRASDTTGGSLTLYAAPSPARTRKQWLPAPNAHPIYSEPIAETKPSRGTGSRRRSRR